VPRGFLTLIVPDAPKVSAKQSGRLELAEWLTSPKNALALRVIVNRVWQQLFGAGLVRSTDNFGVTGEAPSHPELLDHLAARFVEDGWSIKKLIRSLVLTRTYQLGGDAPKANVEVDPANRLLWRHAPRRLTAEEMRDGILAASRHARPHADDRLAGHDAQGGRAGQHQPRGASTHRGREPEQEQERVSAAPAHADAIDAGGVRPGRAGHGQRQP